MCSPASKSIWRLAIHPTAKLVLLALDHYSNPPDAGLCVQSQETLAGACGLRIRQLRNLLGDLALQGHIEIVKRRDEKGRSIQNGYHVLTAPAASSATGNGVPVDLPSHRQPSAAREAMECRWTDEPPAMEWRWAETDPEYFYEDINELISTGNGLPVGPPAMECRPSLSLKEVTAVTAKTLSKNQEKGDRESGGRDLVGPRQNPRSRPDTLSNPPGFDWRGIAEELRPDLHQLDHVWAKFTAYQTGKILTVAQHEKNWRLWVMREHKAPAPRPERPAVRQAPGSFLASLPAAPLAGHYEVIHEHI